MSSLGLPPGVPLEYTLPLMFVGIYLPTAWAVGHIFHICTTTVWWGGKTSYGWPLCSLVGLLWPITISFYILKFILKTVFSVFKKLSELTLILFGQKN